MRVLFYPMFGERARLTDHVFRAHWYLRPFAERITQIVAPHTVDGEPLGALPDYLDASLAACAASDFVTLTRISNEGELEALVRAADIVLLWDGAHADAPVLKRKRVVRIDHQTVQHAGSYYLKFAERFFPDLQADYTAASQAAFQRIAARCKSRVGHIFGTGPGLAHAADYDFSAGVSIACNSMVRNHALMERLKPPLIVVGDPIFHAGPSSYAAAFRAALIAAMDRYDADLIVPMRDYHVYRTHLPERFAARICAIPFVTAEAPNLDLAQALHVSTTGNVLTLFLLPLAATFFDEIRIFGCDGRPLDQNSYFWAHDKASQFNDEMGAIQRAHPAFFAIDYDDYYLKHCATLETWLAACEAAGKRVSNHTQSYIPALLKRSVAGVGAPVGEEAATPVASIVMPAFNTAEFIEEAVRSVIGQDFTDWELLIVEDGSHDATHAIAERLAREDARIRLMRNPRKGVSSARNTGAEAARGRYIGFLDSDDTMDPGSLRARVEALEGDEAFALAHSIARRTDENGLDLDAPYGITADLSFADMWRNPAHINTILGRAEFIRAHPFLETLANGEDWLAFAQMLRAGARSKFVPNGAVTWRIRACSTTHQAMARHEKSLETVIDWVYAPAIGLEAGLSKPDKAEVLRDRAYGLLIWNILNGDTEGAREILDLGDMRDWRISRSPHRRRAAVEAVGVRVFRKRRGDLRDIDPAIRREIAATNRELGLAGIDTPLAETIGAVFDLDTFLNVAPIAQSAKLSRPVLRAAHAYLSSDDDVLACDETLMAWELRQCSLRHGDAWFPVGGPDALRPATRVVESDVLGVHGVRRHIDVAGAGAVEIAGFVRSAGRHVLGLWLGEEGAGVIFDLNRCVVADANPSVRFPMLDAEISASHSEWGQWRQFRVVVLVDAPCPLLVQMNLRESVRGATNYQGDGRSGADVWGVHALASQVAARAIA